jgi:hypothetical protein
VSDAYLEKVDLLPDADAVAGRWDTSVDLRPIAATGCCSHCGGGTWQHQAHDICGRCGHVSQHEIPEVRLVRRVGVTITTSPRIGRGWQPTWSTSSRPR